MFDILLDGAGDLVVEDGDIKLTNSISQAISIRLKWFYKEWKFDESLGIPYYEDILIKGYDLSLVDSIFKKQILSVDGVSSVETLKVNVSKLTRELNVKYKIILSSGEILNEEVSINA